MLRCFGGWHVLAHAVQQGVYILQQLLSLYLSPSTEPQVLRAAKL
jgi:hypothetical protein